MIDFKQLGQLIRGRWIEFCREPSAVVWVALMPILWMVGLGFAFSNPQPETYKVGVVVDRQSSVDIASILDNPQIKLEKIAKKDVERNFKSGAVDIAVEGDGPDQIRYIFDPLSPESGRAKSFVDNLIQQKSGRVDVIRSQDTPMTAKGTRYIDFLIPGLLALSVMSSSLFGTGMTIVANRRDNLLRRYMVSPMKNSYYILSHIVGRFIVLTFEFLVIMIAGALIFDFGSWQSLLPMFVLSLLGAAVFTSLALLIASRTKNVAAMAGMVNLIIFPMMMLSGVFFSTENFPKFLEIFSRWLPLTGLCDALRGVVRSGLSLSEVSGPILYMVVLTFVFSGLALKIFRWE